MEGQDFRPPKAVTRLLSVFELRHVRGGSDKAVRTTKRRLH